MNLSPSKTCSLRVPRQLLISQEDGIYSSHNEGLSWEKVSQPLPSGTMLFQLIPLDSTRLIALAGAGGC